MSLEIPDNNREILQKVGPNSPFPQTSSPLPSERNDENCYRKLLSSKRQLVLKMHNLESRLRRVTPDKIWDLATQFREVEILLTDFKTRVNSNISDSKTKAEFLEEVDARFEGCHKLYENVMRDGLGGDTEVGNSNVELSAEDSTSQSLLLLFLRLFFIARISVRVAGAAAQD